MKEDMRNLFFIVKGQYSKSYPYVCSDGETRYIGGYNPQNAVEWYQVLDRRTYHCICCGSDLSKMLKGIYNTVVKYKGSAKKYFKMVSSITSEDYYEVTYLGRKPLSESDADKKSEGRCSRVPDSMKMMYKAVDEVFGDYLEEDIEEEVSRAYEDLKNTDSRKAQKKVNKLKKSLGIETETGAVENNNEVKDVKPLIIKKKRIKRR